MHVFWICPFDRARLWRHVQASWKRQDVPCSLIVVENGGARYAGACTHRLTVEPRSLSLAMAAGLTFARELAADAGDVDAWAAKLDAGAHYGARYVPGIQAAALRGAQWSGYPVVRVRLQRRLHGFWGSPGAFVCSGGTLAARLDVFAPYPDWKPWRGDDAAWCSSMLARRLQFLPRGPEGFTRVVRPDGVSRRTDAQWLQFAGLRKFPGGPFLPSSDADMAAAFQSTRGAA